jgi:hypothetical protein
MSDGKVLYYPVWVTKSGGIASGRPNAFRWGKPCDTPSEARNLGRTEVVGDRASLSFVVKFAGGERTPLASFAYPASARMIIEHWEALWDVTELPDDRK